MAFGAMKLGEAVVEISADESRFDRALAGLRGKTALAVAGAVAAGAAAFGGLSFKIAAGFEAAMSESVAIMGDLSDQMRKTMERAARDVALTTTFSAKQSAEAFFFLASAGLSASASIAALPKVAAFAQAGMFDLARATELLTDAQSTLGLAIANDAVKNMENMVRVSDVLVKANILSNASVEEFATALTTKAGAAMRDAGKEIEEGVAVLAAFAKQGIKGELAGEKFSIVMRDLQTRALENNDAFRKFNVAVFDSHGEMRNLADIVGDLEHALAGMSDAQRKATLAELGFSDESVSAIQSLLGMSDAVRNYEKELRSAAGITDEVAKKQLANFNAQFTLLRHAVTDVMITIGTVMLPVMTQVTEFLNQRAIPVLAVFVELLRDVLGAAVKAVTGFLRDHRVALVGVSAAITVLALPALAALTTATIGAMIATLGLVAAQLVAVAPWIAAAVAVGLLAAGIYLLVTNWEEVEGALVTGWERVAEAVVGGTSAMLRGVFGLVASFVTTVVGLGVDLMRGMAQGIAAGSRLVFTVVGELVKGLIRLLNPFSWLFGSTIVDVYRDAGRQSGQALVAALASALSGVRRVADVLIEPLETIRGAVRSLHDEMRRLLGLPTVESAAEDVRLAQLNLRAFQLEPAVGASEREREQQLAGLRAEMERLTDARTDDERALRDQRGELDAELRAFREGHDLRSRAVREVVQRMERELAALDAQIAAYDEGTSAIDLQIAAIERQIEATEAQRSAAEREAEAVRLQIEQLERLGESRQLERSLLEARGLASDRTLATDREVMASMEQQIGVIGSVTAALDSQVANLHTAFIPGWASAGSELGGVTEGMATDIGVMTDGIETDIGEMTADIEAEVTEMKEEINKQLDELKGIFTGWWTDLKNDPAWWEIKSFIIDTIPGWWQSLRDHPIWWNIKSFFIETVPGWFRTGGKAAGSALADGMKAGLNTLLGFVETAINWILGKLSGIGFEIPGWVPKVGGKGWHFSDVLPEAINLPELAQGGIVPSGAEMPAMLHGPEAVLPLSGAPLKDLARELAAATAQSISKALDGLTTVLARSARGTGAAIPAISLPATLSARAPLQGLSAKDLARELAQAISAQPGGLNARFFAPVNVYPQGGTVEDFLGSLEALT